MTEKGAKEQVLAMERLRFVSFSPFIIIEESNLQRFSHSL